MVTPGDTCPSVDGCVLSLQRESHRPLITATGQDNADERTNGKALTRESSCMSCNTTEGIASYALNRFNTPA